MLLIQLANTARQAMEEDAQRIKEIRGVRLSNGRLPCLNRWICVHPLTISYSIGTIDERIVENFMSSVLQKVIEINLDLEAVLG